MRTLKKMLRLRYALRKICMEEKVRNLQIKIVLFEIREVGER